MQIVLNGHAKDFATLSSASTILDLLAQLEIKGDRVALERNGEIVSRAAWSETVLVEGDKIELVHFVGGGSR